MLNIIDDRMKMKLKISNSISQIASLASFQIRVYRFPICFYLYHITHVVFVSAHHTHHINPLYGCLLQQNNCDNATYVDFSTFYFYLHFQLAFSVHMRKCRDFLSRSTFRFKKIELLSDYVAIELYGFVGCC